MADTLNQTGLASQQIGLSYMDTMAQSMGDGYQQLIGGAGLLTRTGASQASKMLDLAENQSQALFKSSANQAQDLLSAGQNLVGESVNAISNLAPKKDPVASLLPIISLIGGLIIIWSATK